VQATLLEQPAVTHLSGDAAGNALLRDQPAHERPLDDSLRAGVSPVDVTLPGSDQTFGDEESHLSVVGESVASVREAETRGRAQPITRRELFTGPIELDGIAQRIADSPSEKASTNRGQ
jgi:hypothetical protein